MGKGIRILGIDDAPFDKFKDKEVLLVGVVIRNGKDKIIEGILSTKIEKDGDDAGEKIIKMIKSSKFKDQIKIIFLHGTTFGGLNLIDLNEIYNNLKVPTVAVLRKKPNMNEVKNALIKAGKSEKLNLLKNGFEKFRNFYIKTVGIKREELGALFEMGFYALRTAHLIGSGIIKGESSGRL
jgi:endonuclease V-like protein UPF0215 family